MSGLATIRRHTCHKINPQMGCYAGLNTGQLQQFAMGYITVPPENLQALTFEIWGGKKRYDAATDTLIETGNSF